jgi:hypothetical protein
MQTFLPYASFTESAKVLDYKRLGKQRVEVLQLLKALHEGGGWVNHPAAKMWRGHTDALVQYGLSICDEWIARGYKDTCREKIRGYLNMFSEFHVPLWNDDEAFHASHRSNLLRKNPEYYGQFGWTEPDDLPYVWPVP